MKQGRQPAGTESPSEGVGCREGRGTYSRVGWEAVGSAFGRAKRAGFPPPPAPHSSPHRERASQTAAAFAHRQTFAAPARDCGSGIRAGARPHGLRPVRGAGAAHAHKESPTAFKSNQGIKNRPLEAVGFCLYFIRRPRFLRHPHPSEELQRF